MKNEKNSTTREAMVSNGGGKGILGAGSKSNPLSLVLHPLARQMEEKRLFQELREQKGYKNLSNVVEKMVGGFKTIPKISDLKISVAKMVEKLENVTGIRLRESKSQMIYKPSTDQELKKMLKYQKTVLRRIEKAIEENRTEESYELFCRVRGSVSFFLLGLRQVKGD